MKHKPPQYYWILGFAYLSLLFVIGSIGYVTKQEPPEVLRIEIEEVQNYIWVFTPDNSRSKQSVEVKTLVRTVSNEELIIDLVIDVCKNYSNVDPLLVNSIIQQESMFDSEAVNGSYVGLMGIGSEWHENRMEKLEVTNLLNPRENITVGVDYLSELLRKYETPLALMLYSMDNKKAFQLWEEGIISTYANQVLGRYEKLKKGV